MVKYAQNNLNIKRAFCVPNGSDPELFNEVKVLTEKPSEWGNKFVVLWAGNAALPQQAMQLMFDVAKKIKELDSDILFVFINSEEGFEFPQEENIAVLSKVNYLNLPGYINNADICLCLYNSYDWYEHGCYISPLKLFDYMSCAKTVIASDMGQISLVVKDGINGILTDNNIDDIVQKIIDCKVNQKKTAAMGKEARKTIKEYYNWDRVARQTEEVLLSIAGKR